MAKHLLESLSTSDVVVLGRLSSSQDAIIISKKGIVPCHTAGHRNVAKVLVIIEN